MPYCAACLAALLQQRNPMVICWTTNHARTLWLPHRCGFEFASKESVSNAPIDFFTTILGYKDYYFTVGKLLQSQTAA
jgi:hypothetical protein